MLKKHALESFKVYKRYKVIDLSQSRHSVIAIFSSFRLGTLGTWLNRQTISS